MNYKETTEYLFNQMPMFERQGASGYKEGLSNTLALDEHFGHPHRNYKTIHVAGTNGKGSCSHTIASILQGYGLKVGLYTSPHLVDFRERIRINGVSINEEYVIEFVEREHYFFEPLCPSFFEVTTAMALKYFADMKVDVAVIEVGLGGRLDCTNIISPLLSIITNISLDHTQFLGRTLTEIATEKAGIIKPHTPVVIGEYLPETRSVFESKACEMNATICFAEDENEITGFSLHQTDASLPMEYHTKSYGTILGELGGIYQSKNANTVLCTYRKLVEMGYIEESTDILHEAFANVCKRTGLMGRWQTVSHSPLTICDTGHNVGGWQYLSKQIADVECDHKHIVFGMVADKDVDAVLALLPKDATYYFTQPETKRAMSATELYALASRHGLNGSAYTDIRSAYNAALKAAYPTDLIFVGGSNYLVAEFLVL